MPRDTRHYARIHVPNPPVVCEGIDRPLDGKITVMGLGGLFIRTREPYPAGTVFRLRFTDEGETVEAMCAVRDQNPQGMGVEFVELRGKSEENLKKIMERLTP
jgi:hypothetical protein